MRLNPNPSRDFIPKPVLTCYGIPSGVPVFVMIPVVIQDFRVIALGSLLGLEVPIQREAVEKAIIKSEEAWRGAQGNEYEN